MFISSFSYFATIVYSVVVNFFFRIHVRWFLRYYDVRDWSRYLSKTILSPHTNANFLRTEFHATNLPRVYPGKHTVMHPMSAAWRSSTTTFADMLAAKLELGVFVYQASPADVKAGYRFYRDYHWGKDVNVPISFDRPKVSDLVVLVDVDYYVDMPNLLLDYDNPVLLYNFCPEAAAASTKEFSFTFNSDAELIYNVAGGGSYKHLVWDYGIDTFTVTDGYYTKSYHVERIVANEHHQYVLLVPSGKWIGRVASWMHTQLSNNKLARLAPIFDDFIVFEFQKRDGRFTSVARVGTYEAATVDSKTMVTLNSILRNVTTAPSYGTIQSKVNDETATAVLFDYFRAKVVRGAYTIYSPKDGLLAVTVRPKIASDKQKPCMASFMAPILKPSFVPNKNLENDMSAIKGRVIDPGKASKLSYDKFMINCFADFIALAAPKSPLDPYLESVVLERQKRPNQRALLEESQGNSEFRRLCKSFMKAEPSQKLGADPRIITTFPTTVKREYSRFIYPLSDYFQKLDWYAFGHTPLEISELVVKLCTKTDTVVCADASRFDGHVSNVVRDFERMLLLASFKPEHHNEIITLHSYQYNFKAVTAEGFKYDTEFQRGSGSPETAFLNTVISKFIDYYTRRCSGDTSKEAYSALGVFGGDDSIAESYAQNDLLVSCAARIGQVYEVDTFSKGSSHVNFLSRFYTSDVWFGDNSSTCDLRRILSKLHLTGNSNKIDPKLKLSEKLSSLALTDLHTPIIDMIIQLAVEKGYNLNLRCPDSYWSKYDITVNWPNKPISDVSSWLKYWKIEIDFNRYAKQLFATDPLNLPCIEDLSVDYIVPKVPVSVNADTVIRLKSNGKKICKYFVLGKCKNLACRFEHKKEK